MDPWGGGYHIYTCICMCVPTGVLGFRLPDSLLRECNIFLRGCVTCWKLHRYANERKWPARDSPPPLLAPAVRRVRGRSLNLSPDRLHDIPQSCIEAAATSQIRPPSQKAIFRRPPRHVEQHSEVLTTRKTPRSLPRRWSSARRR